MRCGREGPADPALPLSGSAAARQLCLSPGPAPAALRLAQPGDWHLPARSSLVERGGAGRGKGGRGGRRCGGPAEGAAPGGPSVIPVSPSLIPVIPVWCQCVPSASPVRYQSAQHSPSQSQCNPSVIPSAPA